METIYKYNLPLADVIDIDIPQGARLLHVAAQGLSSLCLWAIVDPDSKPVLRRFRIAGTGHPLGPGTLDYVGTAHLHGGTFVVHVFEMLLGDDGG